MASAHALTNHDEIRTWAEERGGKPACVRGTGGRGDTGMIRLDFPGYSGARSLQPITWDEWFKSFDENDLALLVQDRTARGVESNFNKLVARRTAEGKQHSRREARGRSAKKSRKAGGARKAAGARKTAGPRKATSARKSTAGRTAGARKTTRTRKTAGAQTRRGTGSARKQAGRGSRTAAKKTSGGRRR